MDNGFINAGMPVSGVTCCLRPVRCRRLFARLQHCPSDWVSKNQQNSLCIGTQRVLDFPHPSPSALLWRSRVDEVIVVKKEIQRARRERAARQLQGMWGRACRECGDASILAMAAGAGIAEPGWRWSGCWGASRVNGSSSWQAGERHGHQGLPEHGLILVKQRWPFCWG